jgi:hypothetical protein
VAADPEVITIDLERDLIDGAVLKVRQTFRVALSAVVATFARGPTRANVDLGARFLATNLTAQDEPPVPDLPVITPRGNGYGLYFDMAPGDLGVALCCDMPVRGLYEDGEVVTPQRVMGHDYGCAVLFPGGRVSSSTTPTDPPNPLDTIALMADDSSAAVILRGAGKTSPAELGSMVLAVAGPTASLLLGSDTAVIPPACAPQVLANLQDLNTRIQAWVPVPNDGGASLKPIFLAWVAALQNMADAKARLDGP